MLEAFRNVNSISISPECKDCLQLARNITSFSKPITRLGLSTANIEEPCTSGIAEDGSRINDDVWLYTFITPASPKPRPMPLVDLALDKVDLTHCKRTYATVLSFEKLKNLQLRDCPRADLFLDAILYPNVGLPAQLKRLTLSHTESANEQLIMPALDRFLGSFRGLRSLHVRITNDGTLPSVAPITRHGDTLESLYLSTWIYLGKYSSWIDALTLTRLFSGLPKLRELAMPFHQLPPALDPWSETSNFKTGALEAIAGNLKCLALLNVLNWPKCQMSNLGLAVKTYEACCGGFATAVFQAVEEKMGGMGRSKFRAIVFG